MTSISLLDFFRSGQFGPIQLGMTRQEVYDLLGEPDGYGCPDTHLMKAGVWLYDAIELHFSPRLWLITTDHISYPDWWGHSESIRLDAWLFSDGRQPSKSDLEDGLTKLNIPYQYIELEQRFEDDAVGKFLFESGVEILIGVKYIYEGSMSDEQDDGPDEERIVVIPNEDYRPDKGWAVVIKNVNYDLM
jgi:hypothetical protein